ncbi:MAG: S-methyl-5-thioribose-1-phosphate isomerase [Myxococcota bacterium]|nr:S-methyl-5-thioribose-1-phosphate isomerase [Myxococcota bacterium]
MVSIKWDGNQLQLLDQRLLPHTEKWLRIRSVQDAASAIKNMIVRGAPAIAITAAYGMALAVKSGFDRNKAHQLLLNARPTAVNLQWALERIKPIDDAQVCAEAEAIHHEDLHINQAIGHHGAKLLSGGVLTICNTGALATSGHGTALGMIRSAHDCGQDIHVYALETRPYLQGARLTAFECLKEAIPCTLITDGMAGALLKSGRISAAVAGCDRVARNGDTANKIGTYQLAILCRHHNIPFHIAMPWSTWDPNCPTGNSIPIEQRPSEEVRTILGNPVAPDGVEVWNPSFDVTPAELVTSWITETGICHPPFSPPA